nr:MAG TPA: hypothetical protein [Caudoviricetes sp.]
MKRCKRTKTSCHIVTTPFIYFYLGSSTPEVFY